MWNEIVFTGIELTSEERKLIERNMENAIVYWSDTDCKHWCPTFRTAPFDKEGFWVDVFDIDLAQGTCRVDVFQHDEPMEGDRLVHHLYALETFKALV